MIYTIKIISISLLKTLHHHQLVIEFIDNHLLLAKRQKINVHNYGNMTNNGLLIHIGSSSIRDSNKKKEHQMIFDKHLF